MPDFMQTSRRPSFREFELKKRGKFFPFFDRYQQQRDPVTITENATLESGGVILKHSTDFCSADFEDQQTGTLEETGFPTVVVEFAPHNALTEDSYAPTGFTEITQFVRSISGNLRQRTYEIGRIEAGSISLTLDNHDGRFTPGTHRSPYFPDIKANRRLRVRGTNMQNPNIATGGGNYGNTIGFRKGTGSWASGFASEPALGKHYTFLLPDGVGTNHIETTLAINATVTTHDLLEFYAPIELGVRMSHSAYVWRTSGVEAPDSTKEFIIVYYDAEGNELTPINDKSCTYSWTDETPSTPMRVHISDQPPALAKYGQLRLRVTHNSMKNVYSAVTYAISGIQSQVPENNLAPFNDAVNWFLEGNGQIYNDGQDGVVVGWGTTAVGAGIKIPRLVPGETYTFTAHVRKEGVDLIMTGDDGQSGYILDAEDATIEVSSTFVAQRPEQEIKLIPLEPPPPLEGGGQASVSENIALFGTASGSTANCQGCGNPPCNEVHAKAINGSWTNGLSDKFCTLVSPGLLVVDVGTVRDVQGFIVRHARAGGETALYNTRDFSIQVSDDNVNWTTVESVNNNEDDTTIHNVDCRGRYFRLNVTDPTQTSDVATRIYEFEIYSKEGVLPTTTGSVAYVQNLTVRKGDTTDVDDFPAIPNGHTATEQENGVTAWELPKPIFEGWTEDWPATAGDLTSSTEITVNDRSARLGGVELSHTLKEALFKDKPNLLITFAEDPIDSQGKVANLGSWADTNGMAVLPIVPMNVDITGATFTQGVAGPTDENAIQFTRQDNSQGYLVPIPYTPEFVPKLNTPSDPTGPLPLPADGTMITKKYFATWSHSYTKTGALKSGDSSSPFIYQGDCTVGDGACSGDGDLRGLIGFNFNSIISDLTGATVRYVGLSIHAVHWWFFDGGVGVFGTHGYTDRNGPSTWSSSKVREGRWRIQNFRRDSWKTFTLGVGVAAEFLSNATTGIAVGPALTNDLDYYGYFDGAKQIYRPYLTIQYVKASTS